QRQPRRHGRGPQRLAGLPGKKRLASEDDGRGVAGSEVFEDEGAGAVGPSLPNPSLPALHPPLSGREGPKTTILKVAFRLTTPSSPRKGGWRAGRRGPG